MAICVCSTKGDGEAVHNDSMHYHPRNRKDTSCTVKYCKCKKYRDSSVAKIIEKDPEYAKIYKKYNA